MDTLKARIASFSRSSKRAKSLSKSTSGPLKWPHPASYKATPNTLAEAGFYYNPSSEFRDNVSCFMCEKELADWNKNDDPFAIHWNKCTSNCAWAMVRCSLMLDLNEDGSYHFSNTSRLPSSKAMEKARLETYTMHSWPHDSVKGHCANSKKMAKAGFVYTPQADGDDTASCFYCGVSLSGWDHDDDPLEEHRKREERTYIACPFFAAATSATTLAKSTNKAPSRVSSKPPSRTASQSKINAPPIAQSEAEVESSDEGRPVPRPGKSTGITKGKKSPANGSTEDTGPNPTGRRATRSRSTRGKAVEASEDEDVVAEGSGSESGKKASKTKRKGKAMGKARMESVQEEQAQDENEDTHEEPEPPKPKRGRPPSSKKPTTSTSRKKRSPNDEDDADDVDTAAAGSSTKPRHTRARSKTNLQSDVESQDTAPSRAKSTTRSGKSTRTPAPDLMDSTAVQSVPSQKRAKPPIVESRAELVTSKSASKGRVVSRSKSKPQAIQGDSNEDRVTSSHERLQKPESSMRTASVSRKQVDPPSRSERSQTKSRKSSSTSDDAGYATAELPMDVDEQKDDSRHSAKKADQGESNDIVMPDGHDRDSGRAESVGPSSPSHNTFSQPNHSERSARDDPVLATVLSSGTSAARTEGRTMPSSSPPIPSDLSSYNTLAGQVITSKSKKGKEKMQVDGFIVASPPREPVRSTSMADMDTDDDQIPVEQAERGSESNATPSPPTSSSSPSHPPDPSTPKSRTVQFLPAIQEPDRPASPEAGLPDSLTPLLAVIPMEKLTFLTEEESGMTIEQYIRREIEIQYERFKEDGEKRIALFKEKAAATRRVIEAS